MAPCLVAVTACEDVGPADIVYSYSGHRPGAAPAADATPGDGGARCVPAADDATCDGVDDDCDGEVDEDPPCNGCPTGTLVPPGWVCVPAGELVMGSPGPECPLGGPERACLDPRCDTPEGCPGPGPGRQDNEAQHRVRITRPYLVEATEVTQGEWRAVARAEGWPVENPSRFDQCGDDCPVEQVSWYAAVAYCNALSRAAHLEECYAYDAGACVRTPGDDMECDPVHFAGPGCAGFRLPTEAEWERAARGGTATAWSTGDDDGSLVRAAWYASNSDGRTHEVRGKGPNPFGLYDVHGNVWEWVWDRHADHYGPGSVTDPSPNDGPWRVCRGGSWGGDAARARSANRFRDVPGRRGGNLGLRVARPAPARP